MIPKTIHLCWLSGDPYPSSIQQCLESWRKHLPTYEIVLWDTHKFDVDSILWTSQAFKKRKYAFAADYIRLYALYHQGGIYMDSDVLVYKPFDDLLHLPYFIGEDYTGCFEPAIIGTEKGNPWIKEVLDYYEGRTFVKADGSLDTKGLPVIFNETLSPNHTFRSIDKIESFQEENDEINIFTYPFFNGRDYTGAVRYKESYCSHNYLGSWYKKEGNLKDRLKAMVPHCLLNKAYQAMFDLGLKKVDANIQILYSNK